MKPKVSVIMPVYNSEEYLFQSIESMLKQTLDDFEFIIIDDGSVDNSLEIIKSFKDSRIKVYVNEINLGISKTLNRGIDLSNGSYIARMDSDDVSVATRLEKQYNFMENNKNISICGSNMHIIDNHGVMCGQIDYCTNDHQIKTDIFFGKTPFAHPTIMIRKSFIKHYNIRYNAKAIYAEDLDLYCHYCNVGTYSNLSNILHFYRIYSNSVSIKHKVEQRITARAIIKEFLNNEGLNFTSKEFDVHCLLYLPNSDELNICEEDALSWFNKCNSFIKNNQKYDKKQFDYLSSMLLEKVRGF